jgi:hypothetical protein
LEKWIMGFELDNGSDVAIVVLGFG